MTAASLSISQKLCTSVEEFSINAPGHNIRPLKIQPGAFNSFYSLIDSTDFLLMIRQVEYQFFEAGELKPDTYGFAFLSNNGSIVYNGKKYKHTDKLITCCSELDAILSNNLRMTTCFINHSNLQRFFIEEEIALFQESLKAVNHKSKRTSTNNEVSLYLNDLTWSICDQAFVISNDVIYNDLCESIYLKLFNYATDTQENACKNIKPKYRLDLLKRALTLIHETDIKTLKVTDVCQHIHTSHRNLHNLFVQYLGVNPKTYLIRERLNKIHQDLLQADTKITNIRNISQRYGVIHQGNFANDYFNFFGEYPKDTIRKNNVHPIKPVKKNELKLTTMSNQKPSATVLYIEDDPDSKVLLQELFERYPAIQLLTAWSAEEGIQLAGEHNPELIFIDIKLPWMSGKVAIKHLLGNPGLAHTRIYAISADVIPENITSALESGLHGYITKPVDLNELIEIINTVIAERSTQD